MRGLALLRTLIVVFYTTSTAVFDTPDVVYVNGKVLTVDDQFSITGGFAVESGRFVAVGDSAGIQQLAGRKTKVVDLGGRTVTGFRLIHSSQRRTGGTRPPATSEKPRSLKSSGDFRPWG